MLIETAYQMYSAQIVKAMIRFSRDEAAANDAVSQAFTQALVNSTMLESMPEPAMKAWLYAAARNAVIDIKRKEARAILLQTLPEDAGSVPDADTRILVRNMMGRLPEDLRRPVSMKYYQGYNSTEIGRAMGIPASTVRTRLRAALNLMRGMMKGDF